MLTEKELQILLFMKKKFGNLVSYKFQPKQHSASTTANISYSNAIYSSKQRKFEDVLYLYIKPAYITQHSHI